MDRKTVRRYLETAEGLGLDREGGEDQLIDEFLGSVIEKVRPHRCDGHTKPARRAFMARFEDQVDPDRTLPAAERSRHAEQAKKAYFTHLALKSAQARRRK